MDVIIPLAPQAMEQRLSEMRRELVALAAGSGFADGHAPEMGAAAAPPAEQQEQAQQEQQPQVKPAAAHDVMASSTAAAAASMAAVTENEEQESGAGGSTVPKQGDNADDDEGAIKKLGEADAWHSACGHAAPEAGAWEPDFGGDVL